MNRWTPNAAASGRWAWLVVPGIVVVGLLAGGGFYLTSGGQSSGPAAGQAAVHAGSTAAGSTGSPGSTAAGCATPGTGSCAGSATAVAIAASPVLVTILPHKAAGSAHHAKSASPQATTTPTQSATGTATAQPTASASTAPAGTGEDSAAAGQVLALINQARAAAGRPALTILAGLETSSSAHNMTMAGGCGLSHQCPGEAALGDRETAAGVHWTAAGENIGEGGPVADTSAAIAQMAVGLTQSMLDEKPPNDGHRQNILSSSFTHIGIAVYRDSKGTVWLTQDFANLASGRRPGR
jgi:uncharacterized protein YkwD